MQSENTQPENIQSNSLPDNAYRELRPGEEYHPVMPAASRPKEVTLYSVLFGIVMALSLIHICNFSPANLAVTTYNADGASKQTNVRHFSTSSTLGIAVNIVFW